MVPSDMFARMLTALLVVILLTAGSWRVAATQSSSPPYLVVIVMDGFRPDYMTLAPMRHLRALMARGMSYDTAWVGQMEAETPSGHATIATGVYPRTHGVIGFGWRDPATSQFTYLPTDIRSIGSGALTRVIEQGGVPTISDLIHARTRHDKVVSVSGEKLWASAPLGAGADYLLYGWEVDSRKSPNKFAPIAVGANVPPARTHYMSVTALDGAFAYQDNFSARLAVRLADTIRPRALLVNLPAPDIAGHYYGGMARPRDMAEILRGTDRAIGRIVSEYKHLGLYDRTVFVVTADHGMVAGYHRVPIHDIYNTVAHAKVLQLDQALRNSEGSIWLRDPEHAGTLASILVAHHVPYVEGALYKVPDGTSWKFEAESSTAKKLPPALLQAYLDLANTEASPSGADILLPYAENTNGLPRTHKFSGMHGGFSWGSQQIPLIIAGPGVRRGTSHFPAKLVDIAPTIERLVGLPIPKGVDGVVLSDAMANPTGAERTAQSAVAERRLADVLALKAHSATQSR
ncbi:MAG: hypothetical protein NVSMB52_09480 [Chloroflexota bacterium]